MEWEEYGKKIELGRGPIFEKRVLTSLARKMPKNVCHSAIHPHSLVFLTQRTGRAAIPSRFCCVQFSFMILGPGRVPHHQKSTLGSLSNGWKFVVCEFRFWNCCMCVFTSRGQSFFTLLRLRISFLGDDLWLGSSPTFLLHFSTVFQAGNQFWLQGLFYPLTISDFRLQNVFVHAQHCKYCVLYSFFAMLGPKHPWDTVCCQWVVLTLLGN